jgi:hypothetical protein
MPFGDGIGWRIARSGNYEEEFKGGGGRSKESTPASSGKRCFQIRTTRIVPTPPSTTEGTVPNKAAVTPDSNSPSWFEVPLHIECTALTRPRIASVMGDVVDEVDLF